VKGKIMMRQEEHRIWQQLLEELRKIDPGTDIGGKGKHKILSYKGGRFLLKYGNRNVRGTWWFGIMKAHMAKFETGELRGVLLLCLENNQLFQVIGMSPARVVGMFLRAPSYKKSGGKRAITAQEWHALLGGRFSQEELREQYKKLRDEGHPQYEFDVVQHGIGCAIKVLGGTITLPSHWSNWRQCGVVLDKLLHEVKGGEGA
jgi:hypothetical protein